MTALSRGWFCCESFNRNNAGGTTRYIDQPELRVYEICCREEFNVRLGMSAAESVAAVLSLRVYYEPREFLCFHRLVESLATN